MARDTQSSVNVVSKLVSGLLSPLAVPLREFHLTVGHSFVSGMAVLGLITGGVAIYALELQEARLEPITAAELRMYDENIESERLRNMKYAAELDNLTGPRIDTWTLVAINSDAINKTVRIEFPAAEGANQLIVAWRVAMTDVASKRDKEGILFQAIPTGAPAVVTIPWQSIWSEGDGIALTLEQTTQDGRRVRCSQNRVVVLN